MRYKIATLVTGLALAAGLTSCDDVFEPAKENLKDIEQMFTDSKFAQGFIVNVYRNLPGYYTNSEYATDDAVTNNKNDGYLKMATGSWTAANDPMSQWVNSFNSIQNLNLFLENVDKVAWAEDPEAAELFRRRMTGEAYGLRALFMWYALRAHSGVDADGTLSGVLMLDKYLTKDANFNMARGTFAECVQMILDDLDKAEANLPLRYVSIPLDSPVPSPYDQVTTNPGVYNRVMGEYGQQLMDGQICRAIRSRVLLMAASPAYAASGTTWADAADASAKVLDLVGGVSGLDPKGHTYYCNGTEIDNLTDGNYPAEIIWRANVSTNSTAQEGEHFPPSLYGNGRMNPTQNLVDAFGMANGYPIGDVRGGYNEATPYAGRDPRLDLYIVYNGSKVGVNNTVINTAADGTTADALNKRETSTRTGYYMKKRLRMDVSVTPGSTQGKNHYDPRIRYTEIFLNYAEAANRAYGPTGNGGHGYSAYDVIKAIRNRAGITDTGYLDECAADKEKMEQLIRNERRLELCFESFRFYDLRRWDVSLTEPAKGVEIRGGVYTILPSVEERDFADYMKYGPIPMSEVLKFGNLRQNAGWK